MLNLAMHPTCSTGLLHDSVTAHAHGKVRACVEPAQQMIQRTLPDFPAHGRGPLGKALNSRGQTMKHAAPSNGAPGRCTNTAH